MTDTVIHDRKPRYMRDVDTRNPALKTIKDRPSRHSAETKTTPPVTLPEVITYMWALVKELKEDQRSTNEKLKKLSVANDRTRNIGRDHQGQIKILQKTIEGHQNSITLLLEHDHERLNRQVAKQTERNAKKDNSAWSKVKRLLPYKDELAHKYIVD